MPQVTSGMANLNATDDVQQSADVPQLPKPIRCSAQPQCDSARQGLGCDHSMSRAELVEWLDRLNKHRMSVESGPARPRSVRNSISKERFNERDEI